VADSTLPRATQYLVMIRASQINGCSYCTDVYTKDAAYEGETSVRLNLVAAWREARAFTDAERAALELTEEGTRLAALVGLIALINAYNRMNIIIQQPAGDYQPGQWG
jgi:AhpD family alkylhydroperoxidase